MRLLLVALVAAAACSGAPTHGFRTDAGIPPIDAGCGPGLAIHIQCDDPNYQGCAASSAPVVMIDGVRMGQDFGCPTPDQFTDYFYLWPSQVRIDDVGTITYFSTGDFCWASAPEQTFAASQGVLDVTLQARCGPQADASPRD
jgi:hypothetical protein